MSQFDDLRAGLAWPPRIHNQTLRLLRQALQNPAAMATVTRCRCKLQVYMHCQCTGCDEKVQKAMTSMGSIRGVENWDGDVNSGIVTVTGKVNPAELRKWLMSKTGKDVKILCPDPSAENRKQKIISGRVSSSGTGSTARSAPSSRCSSRAESDGRKIQQIDDKMRDLQKDKDRLILKNQKKKRLAADNRKLNEAIDDAKKVVLDTALNNLETLKKLDSLRRSRKG